MERWDAVVIGGGFCGLRVAESLAAHFRRVLVVEREAGPMGRASAEPEVVTDGPFTREFDSACVPFEALFALARGGRVRADEFVREAGPVEPAGADAARLFDPAQVSEVFRAERLAVDPERLRGEMLERVARAGVELRMNAAGGRVRSQPGGSLRVRVRGTGGEPELAAGLVVCCAGSQLNAVGAASGLPAIPLEHEVWESAVVALPQPLRRHGFAVVGGPEFAATPFPPRAAHALTHAEYSRHWRWYDGLPGEPPADADQLFESAQKRTAFAHMARDAARFVPALDAGTHAHSRWGVRTRLPEDGAGDRPDVLVLTDHGVTNYHVVFATTPAGTVAAAESLVGQLTASRVGYRAAA